MANAVYDMQREEREKKGVAHDRMERSSAWGHIDLDKTNTGTLLVQWYIS